MSGTERHFASMTDGPITLKEKQRIWEDLEGMLRVVTSATTSKEDIDGGGVYVGLAGLGLALDKVAQHLDDTSIVPEGCQPLGILTEACKSLAKAAVNNAMTLFPSKAHSKRVTFLEGYGGPLALSIVQQYHTPGGYVVVPDLIKELESMYHDNVRNLPAGECEVLYGRAGFLYSLLLVRHHLGDNVIQDAILQEIVRDIVEAGAAGATAGPETRPFGLMFAWHGKHYLGAAHGVAGILYMLLHCLPQLEALPNKTGVRLVETAARALAAVSAAGNLPSSLGAAHDRLVQWCHGAPGLVGLMCKCHEVLDDSDGIFLRTAKHAAEVIWERGLLKKGLGLCHAISGNGYAFLDLYRVTKDVKYLQRAQWFAYFVACKWQELYEVPDRPASLYEGLAGAVGFLFDVLQPERAFFPGYQLPPPA